MADTERLLNIVEALIPRTGEGGEEWVAEGGERYHIDSGDYRLTIASEDGDGGPPFKFSIRKRGSAVELESLSMSNLSGHLTLDRIRASDALEKLYQLARRQALGVDEAIAEVERDLGIV
jgi:hypothetical protein